MRPLLSTLLTAAVIVAAILAALIALVWWKQERIVFQPPLPPDVAIPPWARRVAYEAGDGQPLLGYVVRPDGGDAPAAPHGRVVVAFHGNADLAVWQLDWGHELSRRTGATVLLAEYRGYGGLGGTPTYESSRRDADAALAFAERALGAVPAEVVLFGHSLGSGVATELAARMTAGKAARDAGPRALVLQSPFTSARAMARLVVIRPAWWAWRAISRVHFDSERLVHSLDVPVWVAHGERDMIVPVRMGRALFDAARIKGRLLIVPRASHNDVEVMGGEEYWRWIESAVR